VPDYARTMLMNMLTTTVAGSDLAGVLAPMAGQALVVDALVEGLAPVVGMVLRVGMGLGGRVLARAGPAVRPGSDPWLVHRRPRRDRVRHRGPDRHPPDHRTGPGRRRRRDHVLHRPRPAGAGRGPGDALVITADGKGIPVRPEALRPGPRTQPDDPARP